MKLKNPKSGFLHEKMATLEKCLFNSFKGRIIRIANLEIQIFYYDDIPYHIHEVENVEYFD